MGKDMRNHRINCQFQGTKPMKELQYLVNYFTIVYIEDLLKNSDLSKEEQIAVLSEMLRNLK